jgi:hypothetical protein
MLIRRPLLPALILLTLPSAAMPAQTPPPKFLPEYTHMCSENLADGTPYQMWYRVFLTEWKGQKTYVNVRAYYKPGSGEFFWQASGFSQQTFDIVDKPYANKPANCDLFRDHAIFLQDGQWDDFTSWNGGITILHSDLKFHSLKKAWSFVTEHWHETDPGGGSNKGRANTISLGQQLGYDFFRPKRLEFDARPFVYNSLESVKRVGPNWELEIKGADEPNRATVVLDSNFKLLSVTKHTSTP